MARPRYMEIRGPTNYCNYPLREENHQRLKIMVPPQNVVCKSGGTVRLATVVSGFPPPTFEWYKDGIRIASDERRVIRVYKDFFSLDIISVQQQDLGIYTIILTNCNDVITVSVRLYVFFNFPNVDGAIYSRPPAHAYRTILRHLAPETVKTGQKIFLRAEFAVRSKLCIWYRNDRIIECDIRTAIVHGQRTCTLTIKNALPSDSGIYTLVYYTEHGYLSSYASVLVNDTVFNNESVPFIEGAPTDVKAKKGDDVVVMAKCTINNKTIIRWTRASTTMPGLNIEILDFGDGYIGFKIFDASRLHSDAYNLTIFNREERLFSRQTIMLAIDDNEDGIRVPQARISLALLSVLAAVGANLLFICKFNLPKDILSCRFFAVWKVGGYVITESSYKFQTARNGGDFLLFINCADHYTSGPVTCELRWHSPLGDTHLINRSNSHITLVPPTLFGVEYHYQRPPFPEIIVHNVQTCTRHEWEPATQHGMEPISQSFAAVGNRVLDRFFRRGSRIDLKFCRFSSAYYYIRVCVNGFPIIDHQDLIRVCEREQEGQKITHFSLNSECIPTRYFFIEVANIHGVYEPMDTTKNPFFAFEHVPGTLYIIRITTRRSLRASVIKKAN